MRKKYGIFLSQDKRPKLFWGGVFCCLAIVVSTVMWSEQTVNQRDPFSYAIHTTNNGTFSISKINIISNTIEREIPIAFPIQYMTVDKDGTLYLTATRQIGIPKHEVYVVKPNSSRIKKLASLPHPYPSSVIPYGDFLYVVTGAPSSDETHIEKLTKKGRFLISILVNNASMMSDDSLQILSPTQANDFLPIYASSNVLLYVGENFKFQEDVVRKNELGILNTSRQSTEKVSSNFLPQYSSFSAINFIESCNKILAFPLGKPLDESKSLTTPNRDLLFLTLKTLTIAKKITLPVSISNVRYAPDSKKIFISSGESLLIFDPEKEVILKTLRFNSIIRYEYIGYNKLLLSVLDIDQKNKLVILDTTTNKIIREFPGNYGPISKRFFTMEDSND